MKPSLLFESPCVMGILNITPDSFSDGGQLFRDHKTQTDLALQRALQMQRDGASIVDIGGESTRPSATKISVQEELDRVLPVIEALHSESDITISIDTSKANVMREAIKAGATFINDVCALQQPGTMDVVAKAAQKNPALRVCLMHMQGEPQSMQQAPHYNDVVVEVKAFLQQRIAACLAAGIPRQQLVIDPGFGFGKTLEHNLALIRNLSALNEPGCPVLAGVSRKSMIAKLTGRNDVDDRLAGSLALAWACLQQGAKILRVHDVRETVDLVKIYQALNVP
jgi:dihydropteroate synthase